MDTTTVIVGVGVVAVGALVLSTFLKVEPPTFDDEPKKAKKQKLTKSQKVAAKAAEQSKKGAKSAKEEAKEEEAVLKAERKREKEKEKKALRKANASVKKAEEDAAAAAAERAAAAVVVAEVTEESTGKKKKKKKKGKGGAVANKESASVAEAEVEAAVQEPVEDDWIEIVTTRKAKVVEEKVDSSLGEVVYSDELFIAQEHIPTVIGPKGAHLNAIQESTGAKVDLPKKGTVRINALITAPSNAQVLQAKQALQQLIAKGYCELTHAGHTDDMIEVPSKFLGQIIGPGGSMIQKLQSLTNTDINTPERDSDSNMVSVVGDPAAVKICIAAIKEIMEKGYSSLTHETWISKTMEVSKDQIGNVFGPSGATIRALQDSTQTKINVGSRDDPVLVTIVGDAADVALASAQIAALVVPVEPEEIPFEWTKEAVFAMDMSF